MAHLKIQERLVFAVTNLGTRIAMAVSQESSAGDFKKKFEKAHLNCFPQHGKISVYGLQVWKKSCFYCLSESFLLKHAFHVAKDWFLRIEVRHVQDQTAAEKNRKRFRRNKWKIKKVPCFQTAFLDIPRALYVSKRKKKNCNRLRKCTSVKYPIKRLKHRQTKRERHENLCPAVDCPSETTLGTVSVSGLISRHFSGYDEVTSNSNFCCAEAELQKNSKGNMKDQIASDRHNVPVGIPLGLAPRTPPRGHILPVSEPFRTSRYTPRGSVGSRLVEASINLGLSKTKQNPALSLSKFTNGRSELSISAANPIRSLIFEITGDN